jgi:RNA polymerase sigma-70 factor (ECF subfamily)
LQVAVSNVTNEPLAQEFDELFRAHYSLIFNTAYSVTGSAEDAEDVAQTIFMRLYRRGVPPGFTHNPKGYLYRAAVNGSLNAVRSRRRHVFTGDEQRLEAAAEARRLSPQSDIQGRLIDAMAQLNPGAVEMLILRYEHNYSDAEIGKLLGKSRGVIAVTLFRARARLKKLLRASSRDGDKHET